MHIHLVGVRYDHLGMKLADRNMRIKIFKKSKAMSFLDGLTQGESLDLPSLLNSIREGEEMSRAEFASKLGVSRSHLCDIERGRKSVSLARAIEFAEILGYSKDQFVRLALQALMDDMGLRYKVTIEAA